MKLIETMKTQIESENSYFRAALLREDIARLEKLAGIAQQSDSLAVFEKDGLFIGWTRGDLRTGELKATLAPFMAAVFVHVHNPQDDPAQATIASTWKSFSQQRMKILVHCL